MSFLPVRVPFTQPPFQCYSGSPMLALTDAQLAVVMTAARGLPVEKRGLFLERVAARMRLGDRFTDDDLSAAVHVALRGLIQEFAA